MVVSPSASVEANACATTTAVVREPSDKVSTADDEAVNSPNAAASGDEVVDAEFMVLEPEEAAELAVLREETLALARLYVVNEV